MSTDKSEKLHAIIDWVGVEWTETRFYCEKCGTNLGYTKPSEDWECNGIYENETCDSKKWHSVEIPGLKDKVSGEWLNLWRELTTPVVNEGTQDTRPS